MIGRAAIAATLVAALAAALVLASASAQTTWVIDAVDPPDAPTNSWDPGLPEVIEAHPGDVASFEFDQARTVHNLFLRTPAGEDLHLSAPPVCDGPLGICSPPPDHPAPIQHTLDQEGEYTYYCTLHGGDANGNGMAGRIAVGEPGGGEEPVPMPNPEPGPGELERCPGQGPECAACAMAGGCPPEAGRREGG
ncbi:MAG TPA: hypothetical protein VK919_09920 [Solirubrobacterales bacterium]|nr:hypothetical protein [Solirubrobacterales bacterium]